MQVHSANSFIYMINMQTHTTNFNKQVVKTPKLYFYDTGVACSLLGISNAKQITQHAAKGFLFENMIVTEMLKQRFNAGVTDNLYYWRDKTGNEVDILTDDAGKLAAIELKAGETIATDFFKGLDYFSALQSKPIKKILLYGGKQVQTRSNGITILPWNKFILE